MLKHVQDLGFRAGEFSAPAFGQAETARALAVLADHYGPDLDPARLVPHEDEAGLRAALKRAAPGMAAIAAEIRGALDTDYSAILLSRSSLDHLDLTTRSAVLFALGLCMGSPTATDRIDRRVIWDIKVREQKVSTGLVSTFSEHPYEADLHTDTQYFQHPERYMLLYFVTAAACGGGGSTLRDVNCLRNELSRTEEGRWAVDFLSRQELPFRIPAIFTASGDRDAVEVTVAPIFGTRPGIRFRTDTLRKGLEIHPEYDTPDVRRALGILQAEIDNRDLAIEAYLKTDSIIFINNHEALHGREPFTDFNRHVLRIRVAEEAADGGAQKLDRAA
jgi:hypothetical protein